MVDLVDVKYIRNGPRKAVVKLTNISDGTGEAAVIKVDLSALVGPNGVAPTKTVVESIQANVQGFTSVQLHFDHTTDDELAILGTGFTYLDWEDVGGHVDPASTGGTGDIVLTTIGASATATYDISITFRLKDQLLSFSNRLLASSMDLLFSSNFSNRVRGVSNSSRISFSTGIVKAPSGLILIGV